MNLQNLDITPEGWWEDDDLGSAAVESANSAATEEDCTVSAEDDYLLLLASQQYEASGTIRAMESTETSTSATLAAVSTEDDYLLQLASQQYETIAATESAETSTSTRFGAPVMAKSIDQLITSTVPAKTRKSTQWAINVWREWAVFRKSSASRDEERAHELKEDFVNMSAPDQSFWLCRFVCKVAK